MKKFNIAINYQENDLYSIILREFIINEEGEQINTNFLVKENISLEECLIIQNQFIYGDL